MYEYTVINNDECNFYRKTIEGSKQDTIKETCKATYGKKRYIKDTHIIINNDKFDYDVLYKIKN